MTLAKGKQKLVVAVVVSVAFALASCSGKTKAEECADLNEKNGGNKYYWIAKPGTTDPMNDGYCTNRGVRG